MAQYFDIIILLIVVVVVFQRLKNVLGSKPDEYTQNQITDKNAAKIFDMIIQEAEKSANSQSVEKEELSGTDKVLSLIPDFNKENFLRGAQRAFEVIVTSFSKGDTQTLEMLVNKTLVKKFKEIIEKRKEEGIVSETDFIGFENTEITDAKISKNDIAKITVKFVSEQVNILKNSKDEVIEGDENFIQNITDVWTFERSLTSTNPNWLLVSTKK